ncbi:FadR family transcriptional regulator [Boseaceae bacterium BT-24-1]|nr:FadR family transcriptional regulator [Boseaceae bacterium BT-24-1]
MSDQVTESGSRAARGSLSEGVHATIRERIASGELSKGSLLPREEDLALQLGVSRTVLREALARLRHDGLIVSKRGTGNRVVGPQGKTIFEAAPPHSIADLEACYEFRLGIEPEIAALASQRAEPDSLRRITEAARRLEIVVASGELGAEQDLAFHAAIASATQNHYYIQTIAAIAKPVEIGMQIARMLSSGAPAERLATTISEHRAILSALQEKDAAASRAAMERHIIASQRRVFVGTGGHR